jgi:metacaspase-1
VKNLLLSVLLFLCASVFSQVKHALLIGVGDYPDRPSDQKSWSDLSSANDISLVKGMLLGQNFNAKNMVEIIDAKATAANVLKALDNLLLSVKAGDIVYIHYSGHGQQIADWDSKDYPNVKYIAKDEGEDGFDEAFVLYNAPMEYFEGYQFNEHLIDDQLDYYVSSMEQKIGKNGQVVVVLDACHSGSGTRGSEPTKKRGSSTVCAPATYKRTYYVEDNKGYNNGEGVKSVFMGCKDDEVNYEIFVKGVGYGSLSYALVEAITNLKDKSSYKNVFDIVYSKLLINSEGKQNAEKDFDEPNALFFSGQTVPKSDFFGVISSKIGSTTAEVGAGAVHGISIGDSLGFYYIDPTKSQKMVATGIVTDSKGATCTVALIAKLPMTANADYSLFNAKRIYEVMEGQSLKLAMELSDKESIKVIKNALKDDKNIVFVDPKKEAPNYYLKADDNNNVRIEIPLSGNPFKEMKPLSMGKQEDVSKLVEYLKQALRIDYFTNLELSDESIDVSVTLLPMSDSSIAVFRSKSPDYNNYSNIRGFNLEVVNNSSDLIYLHAVYIGNNKLLNEIPIANNGKDKFVSLYPGVSKKAKDFQPIITACTPEIDCGVDRIYFFASREKMDFEAVEKLGESLSTRGSEDAFIRMISDGAAGKNQSADSVSGVQLIKYEINNVPLN